MDFECSAPDKWKLELSSYSDCLKSLNKPDLISLDEFTAWSSSLIQNRNPNPHITASELVELMKWKLKRGKWRPRLLEFVSALDDEVVKSASRKAFEALPDVSKAVSELTVLKGLVLLLLLLFWLLMLLRLLLSCLMRQWLRPWGILKIIH